ARCAGSGASSSPSTRPTKQDSGAPSTNGPRSLGRRPLRPERRPANCASTPDPSAVVAVQARTATGSIAGGTGARTGAVSMRGRSDAGGEDGTGLLDNKRAPRPRGRAVCQRHRVAAATDSGWKGGPAGG